MNWIARAAKAAVVIGAAASSYPSFAVSLGTPTVDAPTPTSIGFSIAASGDSNRDAKAVVEFRGSSGEAWMPGLPVLRVRDEFSAVARGDIFAGSVTGLQPGKSYEIRITATDPDGSDDQTTFTAATRPMPRETPQSPSAVSVSTAAELDTALASAAPGDVITLAAGTYTGLFSISASGTQENPIIVQGASVGTSRIVGTGTDLGTPAFEVRGNHVILQDLTLENANGMDADYVLRADSQSNLTNFTMRRCYIRGRKGLRVWQGTNRSFTIYDNVFEGLRTWDWIVNSIQTSGTYGADAAIKDAWNDDGIRLTGEGHAIFNNTFSGFGDTLKIHRETDIPTVSIDYYSNDILWGADDGIELDDGFSNIRAWGNRVANTGTMISRQPNDDSGGPVYAFRNVGLNQFLRPFKLNDGPSGFFLVNNTIVNTVSATSSDYGWVQHNNGAVQNFAVLNNVFITRNTPNVVKFDADTDEEQWDFNGYYPDGGFSMRNSGSGSNLAQAKSSVSIGGYAGASFESGGRVLTSGIFASTVSIGADWTTLTSPQSIVLASGSNAVDAAAPVPGIASSYVGSGPDMGAHEQGTADPVYGARTIRGDAPKAPRLLE